MKQDHNISYFNKYKEEEITVTYKFVNDLGTSETLSSCTATVTDSAGTDVTTSALDDKTVNATNVVFDIKDGNADETYQIKLVGVSSSSKKYTHYVTYEVFGSIDINSKLGDSKSNSYVTLKEANKYIRNKYGHASTWDTLSVEGKKRLLIEATEDIDKNNFINEKYYDSQRLAFPRDDHDIITGNCATPITINSFKNTSLYSTTYNKYPTSYWKYGTVHITSGTPLNDIKLIASSNVTTGSITMSENFSATPTTNTTFLLFAPLHKNIKEAQCEQALYNLKNSDSADSINSYKNLGAKSIKIDDVAISFGDSTNNISRNMSPLSRKLLSLWIKRRIILGRR